jgi:hypothetical protein
MPGAGWRAFATHWGLGMNSEISDGLKDLIDGGAAPVTLGEIEQRSASRAASDQHYLPGARLGARLTRHPGRLAATVAAAAAVITAAAVIATNLAGSTASPTARHQAFLTAAMVRHLASESRLALASAGRAEVTYRDTQAGVVQDYGSDDITFSGKNWNDTFSQTLPASAGQPVDTQFAINRIVNGQAYYYIKGETDKLEWYHDTNPSNHPQVSVPDPRTALAVLEPSARFEVVGYQAIGGLRLTELRATDLSQLPSLGTLPDIQPGEQITSLEVWVDRQGVVHRMSISLQETTIVYPFRLQGLPRGLRRLLVGHTAYTLQKIEKLLKTFRRHPGKTAGASGGRREVQVTQLTVSFLDIGQRQLITAPTHSIPVYALG